MADNEIVSAKLTADTDEACGNIDHLADCLEDAGEKGEKTGDRLANFGKKMDSLGGKLTSIGGALSIGVTAPIVGVAGAAINMGLNAVEAENLFTESFGSMAERARAWSEETSDALGLNEFELRRNSATIFAMTNAMGLSKDASFEMATGITKLSNDMASFFNLDPQVAFDKLRAGISGEAEPLKQLGILVTENMIKQTDYAKAILATGRQLTEQEKVQARYQAILQQTSVAQGDLARTLDSPANKLRVMQSRIEETTTKLGVALLPALEAILPIFDKAVSVIEDVVDAFSKADPAIQTTIIVLGALAAAAGPVLVVLGQVVGAVGTLTGAIAAGGGLMAVLGSIGAFISGTLLPLLAALAVGIALGGAVGVAVSEFLEWLGVIESTDEKVRRLLETMEPSSQQVRAMADASKLAGREITDWGEATKIMNDHIMALRNGTEEGAAGAAKLAEGTDAAGKAAEEAGKAEEMTAEQTKRAAAAAKEAEQARKREEEATRRLADSLGTAGLVSSANAMNKALEELNRRGENLSQQGLDQVLRKIKELKAEGIDLTGGMAALDQKFREMGERSRQVISEMSFEVPAISAKDLDASLDDVSDSFDDIAKDGIPGIKEGEPVIGGLAERSFDLHEAMGQVNDILSEARGLMNIFGIDSESALGKVIGAATKVFDTFNSIIGTVDKVTGAISKIGGFLGGGGGGGGIPGLGGGGGILGSLGGLFGLGGGGGAAAGAGAGGAAAGGLGGIFGSLGSAAGALFTNPFGIAVLGGIGAFFAGKKLLGKLFGGRSPDTVGEEAGRDLGLSISDGLAKTIHESGKNIQLFLPDIFAEGNLAVDRLAEEIGDIFSVFQQGKISEPEAMQALTESTRTLLENFNELGDTGEAQLERVLRASKSMNMEFEGSSEAAAALAERLVTSAQEGGDAWLNATNEIGTTGRESLEFLKNEFGSALPESVLAAINQILGLNDAINETQGATAGVKEEMANLPDVAVESVEGVKGAFMEGSTGIVEGLKPISETMANEIRNAGEETSSAIDSSFNQTNEAIKSGLGQVADTFLSQVAPGALRAADATDRIAEAARRAAAAAKDISFPDVPGGGGADVSAASGFSGVLGRDTMFQAHAGEFVNIVPAAQTRNMGFVSAAGGFGPGPMSINMGDTHIQVTGRKDGRGKQLVELPLDEFIELIDSNKRDAREKLKAALGIK